MEIKIYAVHDGKVEAFMQPFFARTDGEATRGFSQAVNQDGTPFNQHPGDYTLFRIGKFDDQTAIIEPETPVTLGNALEYVNAQ